MNAIHSGDLTAYRNNQNRWQIGSDELSKWVSERAATVTVELAATDRHPPDNDIRIAVLETELKSKNQRIDDLERDRDSWRTHAQELAKQRWWWSWRRKNNKAPQ